MNSVNDIVSLKKEIASYHIQTQTTRLTVFPQAHRSISSMIPLLYAQSGDAQAAVDQTANFLVANVKAFEETAQRLLKPEKAQEVDEACEIREFVMACQFLLLRKPNLEVFAPTLDLQVLTTINPKSRYSSIRYSQTGFGCRASRHAMKHSLPSRTFSDPSVMSLGISLKGVVPRRCIDVIRAAESV